MIKKKIKKILKANKNMTKKNLKIQKILRNPTNLTVNVQMNSKMMMSMSIVMILKKLIMKKLKNNNTMFML